MGASGYVVKRRMELDLRTAIIEALAGRIFISDCVALGVKPEATKPSPALDHNSFTLS